MADVSAHRVDRNDALVISGVLVGTIFEWYDFYLYGSLATFITKHFFSGVNETTGYILALLVFVVGFAVRPFGAIIFGRMGDSWGRKNTFLTIMLLMGLSTFAVGLLPSYDAAGVIAPIALVSLRLIQGLALGGEYGGAATYVAAHAPPGRVGFYTSWIQTTATIGLFLSLVVILATRLNLGTDAFGAWGWRIPFLVSAILLAISLWIRLRLHESPVFQRLVKEGKTSRAPLTEAFAMAGNLRLVVLALLGLTAGQAVVWYTGQFYSLFFLERILKVDGALANELVAVGLAVGTPFIVLFGWLSDRIGRKVIILAGCALAALTYFPLFHLLTDAANPALVEATVRAPITVVADPSDCSFQFDPVGKTAFNSSCDIAKSYLAKAGLPYANETAGAGAAAVKIGGTTLTSFDGRGMAKAEFTAKKTAWEKDIAAALAAAGYPKEADSARVDKLKVVAVLAVLMIYVA